MLVAQLIVVGASVFFSALTNPSETWLTVSVEKNLSESMENGWKAYHTLFVLMLSCQLAHWISWTPLAQNES